MSKFPEKAAKITIQGYFTLGNKYLQAGYVVIKHFFRNSLLRLNQNQIIYTQNRVDRMILILANFVVLRVLSHSSSEGEMDK